MEDVARALHDMCQPLTALQCRLEIGQMNEEAGLSGAGTAGAEGLLASGLFAECLRECNRLSATVIAMRAVVQRAML